MISVGSAGGTSSGGGGGFWDTVGKILGALPPINIGGPTGTTIGVPTWEGAPYGSTQGAPTCPTGMALVADSRYLGGFRCDQVATTATTPNWPLWIALGVLGLVLLKVLMDRKG